MPVYSNDDGTTKSIWTIAATAAASMILSAGTLTADRTLTCPDASGVISIQSDFGSNYNKLLQTGSPSFTNVTIGTKLNTPLIDTTAGLTIKAGSSPLVLQQGAGSSGVTIFDGATNVGSGIWLLRAATSDESAKFRFFTNGVVKWSTGLLGDSSNDFHIFNEATGATGLKLRSTTNNVEIVSNLLIGGTTVPSGGVSTIVLNGSTLGAASSSDVSIGAPSIGGSRRFGVQAGTGNVISLGADRLNYAASTGYVSIAGTDVITITTSGITLIGALPITSGGTGQSSYTNGQLLIGNTTGNTLTKATLTGTANQVIVTNGAGSITLSTPQDIGTASNVQFGGIGVGTAVGTGQAVNVSYAAPAGTGGQGLLFLTTFTPVSSTSNAAQGFFGSCRNTGNVNLTASGGGIIGGLGIGLNLSGTSNTITLIVGLKGIAQTLNTGTVVRGAALMAGSPAASAANVMTTAVGVLVQAQNGLGRTNAYGVYQEDAGDSNYFAGEVRLGTTATGSAALTLGDAKHVAFGTSTGSKLGTSTSQLIGLWNATPVAQYASATTLTTGFTAGAGTPVLAGSTFTGNTGSTAYTMSEVVRALKLCGIMAA